MFKKIGAVVLSVGILFSWVSLQASASKGNPNGNQGTDNSNKKVENVIFMIPDGFNADYATNYRWYKGEDAVWDEHLKGMFKTYSANSRITDSAAAGTAMATGVKTNNSVISLTPEGNEIETILEASEKTGKSTGLVATSTITHATPAVFASHVDNRKKEDEIAKQMIENDVDVLLGGGKEFFVSKADGGKQEEDLIEEAVELGYEFVETREELLNVENVDIDGDDKLLGLFADQALVPELHRAETEQPNIAEMTETAIDVLSQDKDGFFLMVEGSQIDWAGHANDPVWAMTDVEAFEKAVEVALNFAKEDGKTLVVVAGDHETGGMTVGTRGSSTAEPDKLKGVSATGDFMANEINEDRSNVKEVVEKHTGFTLTESEVKSIQDAKNVANAINSLLSKKASVGWTSEGHTGVDIPVYAYGPQSYNFVGLLENTDLPKLMAEAMKIDFNN